jgi:Protein of unknown function (DUF2384)
MIMATPIKDPSRGVSLDVLYAQGKGNPSIQRTLEILEQVFPTRDQVQAWLNRPLPDLGNRTPTEVILLGYPNAVRDMLEAALIGTPG